MERIPTLVLAISALAGSAAVANSPVVTASGVELERVIDNTARPPGIQGEFIFSQSAPEPCNGGTIFQGSGNVLGRTGTYFAASADLEVVANPGIPVPGTNETFQNAKDPVCSGDRVVFLGYGELTLPVLFSSSAYMARHGVITPILQAGTGVGTETIQSVTHVDANEFGVGMVASFLPALDAQGVVMKPHDGDPIIVADRTTVLPGQTDTADGFISPLMVGPDMVFIAGTNPTTGLYRWSTGQGLSVLVDSNTPAPDPLGGTFGGFDRRLVSLDDGIVFGAAYAGGRGLFLWSHGQIQSLVLAGDVAVDGETLTTMFFPSGAGALLSFIARTTDDPREAVYVRTPDGAVKRILGGGEIIDGMTVSAGPGLSAGADRTSVVIRMEAALVGGNGYHVIYRALFADPLDVPGLSRSGIAALVLGLTLAGLWVLRRRPTWRHPDRKGFIFNDLRPLPGGRVGFETQRRH